MNSYFIALIIGLCVYLMMLIDSHYIEPTDKPTSPKVALWVMLLVWILCEFIIFKPEQIVVPAARKILVGGFYNK